MELWLKYLIFIPLAYLVGSINSAVIIARLKKQNIKKVGSGNPGTMNMLRSVGKFLGCLTFILDFFKGVAIALIGALYFKTAFDTYLLGAFVIIGHCFSVFLKFKGGKGVATALGVFAVGNWIAFLVAFAFLLLYLVFFKVGFLGSLFTIGGLALTNALYEGLYGRFETSIIIVLIFAIILFTHRKNITRFVKGKEHSLSLYTNADFSDKSMKDDSEKTKSNDNSNSMDEKATNNSDTMVVGDTAVISSISVVENSRNSDDSEIVADLTNIDKNKNV